MKKSSILIIDDDCEIRNLLKEILDSAYFIIESDEGSKGIDLAIENKPDLILLDLKMPKVTGFEVCKKLRENSITKEIPIIIVTGNSDIQSLTKAFDLGADDFLGKPFRVEELLARTASKLRKSQKSILVVGDLSLNINAMEVFIKGTPIPFSALEFNLLHFFVNHKNSVISRNKILKEVWNSVCVNRRTVDTHIVSLRKKISKSNCKLQTVYSSGYKFIEPQATDVA